MMRTDRRIDELRPIKITRDYIPNAEGSCLYEQGNTRVVCTASIEPRVPQFLRDTGRGWVTAEYAMIPRATTQRTSRESSLGRVGGRTHEIQRLIGRSLRSVVDMKALGEITVWMDCDVITADAGTRTASISGAFIALYDALSMWKQKKGLSKMPIAEFVAAVSVGIVDGSNRLDLDFSEDSAAQVDMNVVMTESGRIVEIQGTAEQHPFTREELDKLYDLAHKGIADIIQEQKRALGLVE